MESLLLAGSGRNVRVFLVESFHAARGVHEFLLTSKERVAAGADFHAQHLAFNGRAGLESMPAGTVYGHRMIIGVNTGFHESPFCRVRSARPLSGQGDYNRVARTRDKPQV